MIKPALIITAISALFGGIIFGLTWDFAIQILFVGNVHQIIAYGIYTAMLIYFGAYVISKNIFDKKLALIILSISIITALRCIYGHAIGEIATIIGNTYISAIIPQLLY